MQNMFVALAIVSSVATFYFGMQMGKKGNRDLCNSKYSNSNQDVVHKSLVRGGISIIDSSSSTITVAPTKSNPIIKCPDGYVDRATTFITKTSSNGEIFSKHEACPVSSVKSLDETTSVRFNPDETKSMYRVFHNFVHPSAASRGEFLITFSDSPLKEDLAMCQKFYMQRSAVRDDQPNKCIAVVRVDGNLPNPYAVSHRIGHIDWPQVLTDQYQEDYIKSISYQRHYDMTQDLLINYDKLVFQFIEIAGDPIDPITGERRTAVIMVANEGVLDLVLNFMCSANAAGADMSKFIVFLGQKEYIPLVNSMGAHAFFHESLGELPREHSHSYADATFTKMMWLKVTSVYISIKAGFNTIFQDADLVWLRDPIPYLVGQSDYDVIFMDDGARTPRFAPYFTNTGFYFIRYNKKTVYFQERMIKTMGEIIFTASHQATLIRYLTEAHYVFDMSILLLQDHIFPSGRAYHEAPKFVLEVVNYRAFPYVWHMCWTPDRANKSKFLGTLGMWFLPAPNTSKGSRCLKPKDTLQHLDMKKNRDEHQHSKQTLRDCCLSTSYWNNRPPNVNVSIPPLITNLYNG